MANKTDRAKSIRRAVRGVVAFATKFLGRIREIINKQEPPAKLPPWSKWYQANKRYRRHAARMGIKGANLPRTVGWWPA